MPRQADTHWIDRFEGYSDSANPGDSPKLTTDLNNVKFRAGRVSGRGGMSKYGSVSSTSSAAIIGLFNYRRVSGTHQLLRMLPTKLEKYSAGSWTDVTGTALAGTTTTRPQYTTIDDTLLFSNEGLNRPRKFDNTGNSADGASSAIPYCKSIIAFIGFLFAMNISDDGTFADVFEGYRIGRYADDWDTSTAWTPCEGNEITLDETPGSWLNSIVVGRQMFCLKSDGVVSLRWTGGAQRFQQDGVPSDVGIVAPLSVACVGSDPASSAGGFFLGNDGIIYQVSTGGVKPISSETLFNLLPSTASLSKLKYARGVIDSEDDTYYLFYDRTGLSTMLLNSYVSFNYRTNEWSKGTLPNLIACTSFKDSDQSAESLLVSSATLVYNLDDTTKDDDGTAVTRYWTTGWQKMAEEGWLHRVRLIFGRSNGAKVGVSIAEGYGEDFGDEQILSLAGDKVTQNNTEVVYRLPTPRLVDWVNVKVRMIHERDSATTKLEKIAFETKNVLATAEKLQKANAF
jgi:hypothetical protein